MRESVYASVHILCILIKKNKPAEKGSTYTDSERERTERKMLAVTDVTLWTAGKKH